MLQVKDLVTRLRNGANIVDGISFGIAPGETFALLGESGCGKSMTALSLMRLLPDGLEHRAGEAHLEGRALFDLPEHEMRQVRGGGMAMIFQEPGLSLNPVMTVGAQIAEVLELHGVGRDSSGQDNGAGLIPGLQQRCIDLLDQVGIPDAYRRVHEYPFQLSGGMKQRAMIAMALAGNPKLLIADEPTTALDVTIQAQVLQLLRDTQDRSGMAMLLITHDLGVVAENAHRVGVMYAGQIVEQATRADLFAKPLHPYTQKLFAALPDARHSGRALAAIPGNVPPPGGIPQGCRFTPRCDKAWDLCHEQMPELFAVEGREVRCHLYSELIAGSLSPVAKNENAEVGQTQPGYKLQATSNKLLQVENLQVHFPIRKGILQRSAGSVKAVDGVSLEIGKGRTLALVGESGCGKTTLGKALLGLIEPTAGSVRFEGAVRGGMAMVFQDPYASLNPKMRVAEIIEEGVEALPFQRQSELRQFGLGLSPASEPGGQSAHPSTGSGRADSYIDTLLGKVGLSAETKWRYPHEFSGGQRQRIAIARALAVSPQLLICDEPTSALDVSVQAQILNLLKTLQQDLGLGYLFITHNLAVVEYLADEVCVMYLGRIVERGTTEDVMRSPKHPYSQALLSAVPRIDGKGREYVRLAGDLPSSANPPAGCHFAPRCPQAMPACAVYPGETRLSATHGVCCHLYGKGS